MSHLHSVILNHCFPLCESKQRLGPHLMSCHLLQFYCLWFVWCCDCGLLMEKLCWNWGCHHGGTFPALVWCQTFCFDTVLPSETKSPLVTQQSMPSHPWRLCWYRGGGGGGGEQESSKHLSKTKSLIYSSESELTILYMMPFCSASSFTFSRCPLQTPTPQWWKHL